GIYQITYQVSGGSNMGTEQLTVNIVDGTVDFPVNQEFFNTAAEVIVQVTQIIDPNTQTNCQVPLQGVSDSFIINASPDVSDSAISVSEPICFGENLNVTLNDLNPENFELQDGIYGITYDLAVENSETITGQDTLNITNGNGTFSILAARIQNPGAAVLTLTSITSVSGCTSTTNLTDDFIISPLIDTEGLTISAENSCIDETVSIGLNSGENNPIPDGIYSITYNLSGANNTGNQTIEVSFSAGSGSFDLPQDNLNLGTSTLTVTQFQNSQTNCGASNLNDPATTFTVFPFPDLTASTLNVSNVCALEPVLFTIEDSITNIPDGSYIANYTLTTATSEEAFTATIIFSDGNGSIALPAEAVAEPSQYDLTLNTFENSEQSCPALGLPRQTSFEIYTRPELDRAMLDVTSVCVNEPINATISNAALQDGNYIIIYSISGANLIVDQEITIEFVNGESSFTIDGEILQNTGENSLTIRSIEQENEDIACATETSLSDGFTISAPPVTSDVSLNLVDFVCLGDNASINLNSANGNLIDGTYTIGYSLTGMNVAENQTAALQIVSGNGSFSISALLLPNPGSTQVIINNITDSETGCSTTVNDLSLDFIISTPPDLENATITIADFCEASGNQSASLNAPNLTDGTYDIIYSLSGANTTVQTATDINFLNGTGSFEISGDLVRNSGFTTLTVTAISSGPCSIETTSINTDFTVNPTPVLVAEDISIASVCLGEETSVIITARNLEDGDYNLTYSLAGANDQNIQSVILSINEGSANFIIPSDFLTQPGSTLFSIESLINLDTG
ncbi:MAG: hypothetical protein WA951_04210, partial [Leeuwenhoekiella sp.]